MTLCHTVTLVDLKRAHLSNVTVFNASSLIQVFAFNPLRGQAAARYGRTTAERLELGVSDFTLVVHLRLFRLQFSVFLAVSMLRD